MSTVVSGSGELDETIEAAKKSLGHHIQKREMDYRMRQQLRLAQNAYYRYVGEVYDSLTNPLKVNRYGLVTGYRIACEELEAVKTDFGTNGEHYDELDRDVEWVEALDEFVTHYHDLIQLVWRDKHGQLESLEARR